jgi:glycosyltransferase involved in cell wall biosynthesis
LGVVIQDLYGAALAETGLGGVILTRATAWLERELLKRADSIVVIHEVFRARLLDEGIRADRVAVIPNWAHITVPESTDVLATRRALGWGDDEFIALHAGNMGVKQGLEGLVDAARLAQERGSRVRVVLLGDGSRRPILTEYAEGAAQLTMRDPLPAGQFEAALAAADCLVLHEKPGIVEMSVPSKLTSYFASGRPVVAATHPSSGAAALMMAAQAGPLARAGDAASLLAAIEHLADNPGEAAAMGLRGQRYATEHQDDQHALDRYAQWLRDLADTEEAGRRHETYAPKRGL